MNRAVLLPALLALTLVGCKGSENTSNTPSVDESTTTPSETVTPDSSTTSEDVNPDLATFEKVEDVVNKLISINGHANKAEINQLEASYMLSDAGNFEMRVKSDGIANHYVDKDNKEIMIMNSQNSLYDDGLGKYLLVEEVTTQVTYDEQYIYRIKDYKDEESQDSLEKFLFSENSLPLLLDFGFGMIECSNLAQFAQFIGHPQAHAEIRGIDGFTKNGTWALSYYLEIYQPDSKIVAQTITYNDIMSVKDGVIIKAQQQIENALYAGGTKANWKVSESNFTYTHGDYPLFEGTLLNPNDYKEVK